MTGQFNYNRLCGSLGSWDSIWNVFSRTAGILHCSRGELQARARSIDSARSPFLHCCASVVIIEPF